MGQDDLFLLRFQQNSSLCSYKIHNLFRLHGGEVINEDGFYAALKDVVQFFPSALQQRLEPAPDGCVDQQE